MGERQYKQSGETVIRILGRDALSLSKRGLAAGQESPRFFCCCCLFLSVSLAVIVLHFFSHGEEGLSLRIKLHDRASSHISIVSSEESRQK